MPDHQLPHACVGSRCVIGSVTGVGCPRQAANEFGWTGCKLRARKADPVLPKPGDEEFA